MIPLSIAISSHLFLMGYHLKLEYDVKDHRNQLSQIIGRSVEIGDFWRRDAQGFPLDREPLKSLIANRPQRYLGEFEYKDAPTAQKKLLEYNKKNPVFVKAINDFLQLPISHVAHKKPEGEMLYSVLMSELTPFRESARYLAMQIAADPNDKQLVKKCNYDLIKLRNWTLQNDFYISYLVAIAIEAIRLDALSTVLSNGKFSHQEFIEIVGAPVDWHKYQRYAYGSEATAFKSCLDYLPNYVLLQTENKKFNSLKKYMPLFMKVHFLRDYRFALQTYIKACTVPPGLPGLEQAQLAKVDNNEIKRNSYLLSGMCMPALEQVYIQSARICNIRQMALLAAEIMEYRKQHGRLPEKLAFLPEIPLSKLDHKPLMYEKTGDGFRIYSNTQDGKIPDMKDTNHSYHIRLPQTK